jgi:arylsulfatase
VSAFAKDVIVQRDSLWWLHEGNRALRVGDYKIVAAKDDPWELYDLKTDRAEQHNLATQMPDKAKQMEQEWERQAASYTELAKKTLSEQPKGGKGKGKNGKGKKGEE